MPILKLKSIGEQVGLILSKEMLSEMKVSAGDEILASKLQGGYLLLRQNSEVGRQVSLGREIQKAYSESFRKLAG